jgi:hypothetical protein
MFAHLEHAFAYRFHVAQVVKLDLAQPLDEALNRVGDFRIIVSIQDHKMIVLVLRVDNRREIYQ